MMFIEDLEEQYANELDALNIDIDMPYTFEEVEEIADRCQSYRERGDLRKRIDILEEQVKELQKRLDKK